VAFTGALLIAVFFGGPSSAGAAGNADAAQACKQGGYATLQGTDGTRFDNTGDCVAYVARGGVITGVSTACAFTGGTSGCVELDSVVAFIGTPGALGSTWTSLSGMFSFAPITSWEPLTTVTVSGSGTWTTSGGSSGTWTATSRSSIYPTDFFADGVGFTTCSAADTRRVGVHFDLAGGGLPADAVMEIGIRVGTTGTNFVQYQAFSATPTGEPFGIHTTAPPLTGVTIRC
jgi:hypothetical protein